MRLLGFLRWYVRELTGTGEYDRYLVRHRSHPHTPLLSRREFERRRSERRDRSPGIRCC
ncbi:CstA-like transporter-associated (seleno)protein [Nonomuraea sp. NPDC048916]|uniref:CstA-like transporter-associated (seleno)protein n=1 Tax=Nonomuraea sp. NPDC048916 TaxID=3154232 RepID=UPI0033E62468